MTIAALIVAAGRGSRAGGSVPKQYARLAGDTVLARSLRAFADVEAVGSLQVVVHPADIALYEASVPSRLRGLRPPVAGGATRQASVLAGLEALAAAPPKFVLIHDAARPFVPPQTIRDVIAALDRHPSACAAVPVADTLKRRSENGTVSGTIDRKDLWAAQTPQGFHFQAILDAHRRADEKGLDEFTDDAAVAEWAGLEVALVPSQASNFKITTPEDLARAAQLLDEARQASGKVGGMEPRIGNGFDVHRLIAGSSIWLCGIEIPHAQRLDGHSDADVGLHALTDAILGALGDGDIGEHFPPSEDRWKGVASSIFLADAARRVTERGGRIVNVDVTLLCEAPRIGPYRDAMRNAIAAILALDVSRVGVKATTTEGLGFTGRSEGIAAMASASLLLPSGA